MKVKCIDNSLCYGFLTIGKQYNALYFEGLRDGERALMIVLDDKDKQMVYYASHFEVIEL